MKTGLFITFIFFLLGVRSYGQETPDTTRIKLKDRTIIIVDGEIKDTIDAAPDEKTHRAIEAHWAGIEFGPTMLLNSSMKSSFPTDPQWENDPGRSFSWNFNFAEYKFKFYKNYVGLTTGLGLNWTQIGLKNNLLYSNADSLWVVQDTVNDYQKNKLRALYLTAPLMIEFCSKGDDSDGFYLAAGVIGGVRLGSSTKQVIETGDTRVKSRTKDDFSLNAFRLDAAVKLGYGNFGVFANYSLLPLFDTDKTVGVYPLTFGLQLNF
jgi:hypothetical protein